MEVTAYDLALISGAFTVLGALIGGVLSHWLGNVQASQDRRALAAAKLREAFLGEIALLERTPEKDHETTAVLKKAFVKHQAAVNEFSFHLPKTKAGKFLQAWLRYYAYYDENETFDVEHFAKYFKANDPKGRENAIAHMKAILAFAEP